MRYSAIFSFRFCDAIIIIVFFYQCSDTGVITKLEVIFLHRNQKEEICITDAQTVRPYILGFCTLPTSEMRRHSVVYVVQKYAF